jgi:hypothetical protein
MQQLQKLIKRLKGKKSKLKLLQHVSVFLHHRQRDYKFCQLKLLITEMIKYNTAAWFMIKT